MRNAIIHISKVFFALTVLILSIHIHSCTKEKTFSKPKVEFLRDTNLLFQDTVLPMGAKMKFNIKAIDESSPITNFVVKYKTITTENFIDTGIYNNDFQYTLEVIKGAAPEETWTFFVMNKDRQSSKISLTIALDTGGSFGPVKSYNITLGAQNNTQFGQFFSFSNEGVYTLEQAFQNQQATDLAHYYHTEYESTLSSPNDNDAPSIFTGSFGISNWQIRNESRYNLTTLTPLDFAQVQNDSLLIASYDIINAKRKGKNAVAGQIWAFRIQSGKIGLLEILQTEAGSSGKIDLSIKIQE